MERRAFVAQLKPAHRDEYIRLHQQVPSDLLARYRQAGLWNISIFLHDDSLFMYLEAENYAAASAALENDPIDLKWQEIVGPMQGPGGFQELPEVFHMD